MYQPTNKRPSNQENAGKLGIFATSEDESLLSFACHTCCFTTVAVNTAFPTLLYTSSIDEVPPLLRSAGDS